MVFFAPNKRGLADTRIISPSQKQSQKKKGVPCGTTLWECGVRLLGDAFDGSGIAGDLAGKFLIDEEISDVEFVLCGEDDVSLVGGAGVVGSGLFDDGLRGSKELDGEFAESVSGGADEGVIGVGVDSPADDTEETVDVGFSGDGGLTGLDVSGESGGFDADFDFGSSVAGVGGKTSGEDETGSESSREQHEFLHFFIPFLKVFSGSTNLCNCLLEFKLTHQFQFVKGTLTKKQKFSAPVFQKKKKYNSLIFKNLTHKQEKRLIILYRLIYNVESKYLQHTPK